MPSLSVTVVLSYRWERERALGLKKKESEEDISSEGLSYIIAPSSKLFS